jgi:hypothetical protein
MICPETITLLKAATRNVINSSEQADTILNAGIREAQEADDDDPLRLTLLELLGAFGINDF